MVESHPHSHRSEPKWKQYLSSVTLIKLLLIFLLVLVPNLIVKTPFYALLELVEIGCIYLIVLVIGRKAHILGYLLSSILTLIVVAQEWVRAFSGTYTTKIMLDNLSNIHALGPSLPRYIAVVVLISAISFLPIHIYWYPEILPRIGITFIVVAFFLSAVFMSHATALTSGAGLLNEYREAYSTAHALKLQQRQDRKKTLASLEQFNVADGINIGMSKPNVVVIFVEGMSQTIIDQGTSYIRRSDAELECL